MDAAQQVLGLFSSLPLLGYAFIPIAAYAGYGLLLWMMGGHGREEARHVWFRSVVAAATVAFALLASVWVGYAASLYMNTTKVPASCLASFKPAPDLNLYAYSVAVEEALDCAYGEFSSKFNGLKEVYINVFRAAAIAGAVPLLSSWSMGVFQAAMPMSGAASGALISLSVAMAAVGIAKGLVALMGLGAFLLATERLTPLGALILAAAMVFPAALAGAADAVREVPFRGGDLGQIIASALGGYWRAVDWGLLVDDTKHAAAISTYIATALSLASAATAAAAYALSRVAQHLSVE
ncbi:MAG: hypothetical protein QXP31_11635 [Pyrobaculum sp.]